MFAFLLTLYHALFSMSIQNTRFFIKNSSLINNSTNKGILTIERCYFSMRSSALLQYVSTAYTEMHTNAKGPCKLRTLGQYLTIIIIVLIYLFYLVAGGGIFHCPVENIVASHVCVLTSDAPCFLPCHTRFFTPPGALLLQAHDLLRRPDSSSHLRNETKIQRTVVEWS